MTYTKSIFVPDSEGNIVAKSCTVCKLFLPLTDFGTRRATNGETKYKSRCKKCSVEASKLSQSRNRAVILAAKQQPCMDCGQTFPPFVMQFDHRDPKEKLFNIGEGGPGKRLEVLKAEIAKCDVVCANCHAIRTHEWRWAPGNRWWEPRASD